MDFQWSSLGAMKGIYYDARRPYSPVTRSSESIPHTNWAQLQVIDNEIYTARSEKF